MKSEISTEQRTDPLQADSVTKPGAHPIANGSSTQMMPAEVAQAIEGNLIVARDSIGHDRGKKRQGQTANCADECKRQRVLHWLETVQKHQCPKSVSKVCGRRGNWCIAGSASKNVYTNVSCTKKTSRSPSMGWQPWRRSLKHPSRV